jgi:hypothetical protein
MKEPNMKSRCLKYTITNSDGMKAEVLDLLGKILLEGMLWTLKAIHVHAVNGKNQENLAHML